VVNHIMSCFANGSDVPGETEERMFTDRLEGSAATTTLGYDTVDLTPQEALAAVSRVRELLARWNARSEVETPDGYLRRIQAALGEPAPQCPLQATHAYFTGTCLHCGQPCGPDHSLRGHAR
jgi:hypothetical protein